MHCYLYNVKNSRNADIQIYSYDTPSRKKTQDS